MADFKSLTKDLEGFFDKPLSALPTKIREHIEAAFIVPWDTLDAAHRKSVAEQIDAQSTGPTVNDELSFTRGFGNAMAQDSMRTRGELRTLRRTLEHTRRRTSKRQSARARKPRDRDAFSTLLKRTFDQLRAAGSPTDTTTVIGALGRYDDDNVLVPTPNAAGQYGAAPDPKRTYYDRAKRKMYFRGSKTNQPRSIDYTEISKRLSRIRSRNPVNRG